MAAEPMRLVVTGASGFIGRELTKILTGAGHAVTAVGRDPVAAERVLGPAIATVGWEGLASAVDGADGVVNLAGEPVAGGRWTESRKRRILDSRVRAGEEIGRAVAEAVRRPRVVVQASAVGFYGDRGDEELDEGSTPGAGFLAEVCRAWEDSSASVEAAGVRRCVVRIGVVLGREGGALARIEPLFRLGLGGRLGSGRQWLPWIHLADAAGAIMFLLEQPEAVGPFNLTGPAPVRWSGFASALGRALGRPAVLPTPAFALRLVFGAMADEALLSGQRATSRRLEAAGFRHRFGDIDSALIDLLV